MDRNPCYVLEILDDLIVLCSGNAKQSTIKSKKDSAIIFTGVSQDNSIKDAMLEIILVQGSCLREIPQTIELKEILLQLHNLILVESIL